MKSKLIQKIFQKIKRKRTIAKYKNINEILKNNKTIKLHLGCGTNYIDGWINIDNNSDNNINKLDFLWDLKEPLPFDDNSVDFIYNEHFLEHLTVEQGQTSLRDFLRILKPNGVMRIAMPDLAEAVKLYLDNDWKKNNIDVLEKFNLTFIKKKA